MQKVVIANWKMNPPTEHEALALAEATDDERIILAPPTLYLEPIRRIVKKSPLCAQNMFWENTSARTGEISPEELTDLGVRFAIIGHSERRALGETYEMIAKKLSAALKSGITPVLCVGETREQHDAGMRDAILREELTSAFAGELPAAQTSVLVAYEPIWAIGTGTPDTAEDTVASIRLMNGIMNAYPQIASTYLYGGSVDETNAAVFFAQPEIGGALVGGASLIPQKILAVASAANK